MLRSVQPEQERLVAVLLDEIRLARHEVLHLPIPAGCRLLATKLALALETLASGEAVARFDLPALKPVHPERPGIHKRLLAGHHLGDQPARHGA